MRDLRLAAKNCVVFKGFILTEKNICKHNDEIWRIETFKKGDNKDKLKNKSQISHVQGKAGVGREAAQ